LVVAHFEAVADPYHPQRNPNGYVNLGTAQNHLLWDLLEPILCAPRPMVASDVHYHPLYGMAALREAVAQFLGRMHDTAINPDDLVVVSGVSVALDILAYSLCEPGDGIAVPVPYYNGLDADYTGRADCRVIPVRSSSADGFALHVDALEAAVREAHKEGVRVRAVTLVTPNNPLGTVCSAETLAEVARFASRHDLALITDEIYACSVFGDAQFSSSLTIPSGVLPPEQVYTTWGFGKDFALSGLRVGVLHTRNPEVRVAARELAYLATVSTDTQALLCRLLSDPEWTDTLLAENRNRLAESYQITSELLGGEGIPHIDAQAGLFVWIDLRQWLAEPTAEAEHALWQTIFKKGGVSISPGTVFHCEEPGWFRLCYAVGETDLREGIRRIGEALRSTVDRPRT
jgi:aspartate/methionine/tyrosine aminotransferase